MLSRIVPVSAAGVTPSGFRIIVVSLPRSPGWLTVRSAQRAAHRAVAQRFKECRAYDTTQTARAGGDPQRAREIFGSAMPSNPVAATRVTLYLPSGVDDLTRAMPQRISDVVRRSLAQRFSVDTEHAQEILEIADRWPDSWSYFVPDRHTYTVSYEIAVTFL